MIGYTFSWNSVKSPGVSPFFVISLCLVLSRPRGPVSEVPSGTLGSYLKYKKSTGLKEKILPVRVFLVVTGSYKTKLSMSSEIIFIPWLLPPIRTASTADLYIDFV